MSKIIHKTRQQIVRGLSRRFLLAASRFAIGDRQFEFWHVENPDSLLDEATLLTPHEELPWQPYWAQLWDAAIGLCHELARRDLSGMRVLDLGCGLGATGAVAASRGAVVVLADNAPPALEFATLNCWEWSQRTTVKLLDWKQPGDLGRFDMILGADILYDPQDIDFLSAFWKRSISPSGIILLAEPNRALTRPFLQRLRELGWSIRATRQEIPARCPSETAGETRAINILEVAAP